MVNVAEVPFAARCPQCASAAPILYRTKDFNRRLSPRAFHYHRCPACGLVYLADPPADLGPFYPADYYSLPPSAEALAEGAAPEGYKITLVQRFVRGGRLIEVGPGRGNFCYLARNAGFETTAIERDAECCAFLARDVGVQAIRADDEVEALARAAPADVITLWHVLEHLREPWRFLQAAASKLRRGGVLVLATPNPECRQFRLFGARWAHLDAPRHLFLVPPRLLVQRVEATGLRRVLMTTRDEGSLGWNRFGWAFSCANYFDGRAAQLPWPPQSTSSARVGAPRTRRSSARTWREIRVTCARLRPPPARGHALYEGDL